MKPLLVIFGRYMYVINILNYRCVNILKASRYTDLGTVMLINGRSLCLSGLVFLAYQTGFSNDLPVVEKLILHRGVYDDSRALNDVILYDVMKYL